MPIDIILFLRGIKIIIPDDLFLLEKIFKLRKEVYEEKGYRSFENGCEFWQDEYDNKAINVGAFKNGEAMGAVRIIFRCNPGFPVENYFNIKEKIPENCAEISKLVVKNGSRGGKRSILIGLMKKALDLSFKKSLDHWIFFMPKGLSDSFRKMNINFEEMEIYPDTEEEIYNKKEMEGYFKQDIKPYTLSLKNLI